MKKEDRILPETHGAGNIPAERKTSRKMYAVKLLTAGAIGLLLYCAHVAFVPVALALLLALVLSSPVEALYGWRVPRSVSAAVLTIAILGSFAALVNFVSVPAQQWFAAAPHTLRVIERKIRPVEQIIGRLEDLRNSAGNIGSSPHAAAQPTVVAPEESGPAMLLEKIKRD